MLNRASVHQRGVGNRDDEAGHEEQRGKARREGRNGWRPAAPKDQSGRGDVPQDDRGAEPEIACQKRAVRREHRAEAREWTRRWQPGGQRPRIVVPAKAGIHPLPTSLPAPVATRDL